MRFVSSVLSGLCVLLWVSTEKSCVTLPQQNVEVGHIALVCFRSHGERTWTKRRRTKGIGKVVELSSICRKMGYRMSSRGNNQSTRCHRDGCAQHVASTITTTGRFADSVGGYALGLNRREIHRKIRLHPSEW